MHQLISHAVALLFGPVCTVKLQDKQFRKHICHSVVRYARSHVAMDRLNLLGRTVTVTKYIRR